ncbi:lipopolysaccharide biosynthesis protein [Maribellus sediminis]|uniref:lipopolysaccharide biosynthesis protein n=1 Tax=Maribellus sediminis TaxID=2696285 RepID=UPI001430DF67|nr:oligosaccharide flippase family protein [Maribellus sediminis]
MSHKKLVKDTAIYAIGEIAPKIIGFFLLPVYTNYLSPADYGILSYTNSVVMFLFVFGALSLNTYVLRFYYEKKTEEEKRKLVGNVFLFIGFINLILFAVAFIIGPTITDKHNIQVPWKPYFQLALLNNLLESFSILPLVFYRVRQNAKLFVTLSLSRTILQFVLTFTFIVVLKQGLIGHYYGRLISLSLFVFIYWGIISKNTLLNFNLKQIKEGLKFALPLVPGAIAYLLLSMSDRIILERHVDIAQVGIYNVAFILAFALSMIVQSGYRALEPEFFKRFGQDGFFDFVRKIQSSFLFVVYVFALVLALFSQEIFLLLASDEYYSGYKLVPIIIIGAIMTGQNVIFRTILTAAKNTKAVGFSSFAGGLISLFFNLSLIPIWGIYAAAISSAVSYFGMNIYLFVKMDFPSKSLKTEFFALGLYLIIAFSVIYYFNIQPSFPTFFLKLGLLGIYTLLLSRIFKIELLLDHAVKN